MTRPDLQDPVRGGVGRVDKPGDPYDGYWLVFAPRRHGPFDVSAGVGQCDVSMGKEEPKDNRNGWPSFSSSGPAGFADVAPSGLTP